MRNDDLEKSYIGMIIHSTVLNTQTKVKNYYGGTTWLQHSGYMLRGATSGVVTNSATKTDGNDKIIRYNMYIMSGSINSYVPTAGTNYGSYGVTDTDDNNIPAYKSVYIWERTA